MGHKQFQGQIPLWSRSLLQEERRQTGQFPWFWSQLWLCRLLTSAPPERKRKGRKPRTRGGLGANLTQEQRRDSHGDTATNQLRTQLTMCSFLHSHGFSSRSLCPITGWSPTPPHFHQGWHMMLSTVAGQDQLSPQAPRAGAEEWRQ